MRILLERDQVVSESPRLEDVRRFIAEDKGLIWLDLDGEPIDTCRKILEDIFNFHPLAIDDALVETHIPKIDDWEDYLYLTLVSLDANKSLDDMKKSIELDVFISKHFVVTYHKKKLNAIDTVWNNCQLDAHKFQRGSNFILYQILDAIADEYMLLIDYLDEKVEAIEDKVIEKADSSLLQDIFQIKHSLLNFRRIVVPQREVLNKLSRGDFKQISQKERMYYRDVYDHFVRIQDITENLRDLVSGALETYLSVVNNRLNNIMKTLTIITTLFMPLSFITGFFGMNFFAPTADLGSWTNLLAYIVTLAILIGLPIGMFMWMRKRDWM